MLADAEEEAKIEEAAAKAANKQKAQELKD